MKHLQKIMTFVCSRFIYELTEIEPRLPSSRIVTCILS